MSRKLRIEYPGAIYHITCRLVGAWNDGDRALYRDDGDRWSFLDGLGERVEMHGVVLHQYVLMANHFHLVVETARGNCSAFMQSLLTAYTVYFNLRHGRHGHLFDGRYKAKLVEGDRYLLGLSRYVHLNPIRVAGFNGEPDAAIRELSQYYWSSYLQYIGRRKRLDFLTMDPTLALMRGRERGRVARYKQFVAAGVGAQDEELRSVMSLSRLGIGGEAFLDDLQERYANLIAKNSRPEDVALRKVRRTLEPEKVLEVLAARLECGVDSFTTRSKGTPYRPFAARHLFKYAGLEQRQIASILGVATGAAVSIQLRRFVDILESDRKLKRVARKCERDLDALLARTDAAHS